MIGMRRALLRILLLSLLQVTGDVLSGSAFRGSAGAHQDAESHARTQNPFSKPQSDSARSSARSTRVSLDPLVVALRKVEAAAQEPVPFGSIKTAQTSSAANRTTTVVLPNADSCDIVNHSPDQSTKSSPSYDCTWTYAEGPQAQESYKKLELAILKSGDWSAKRDKSTQSLRHAAYDASTGAQVHLTLSLSGTKTVKLAIAPGKTQPLLANSTSSKQSASELSNASTQDSSAVKQQMSMGMLAVLSDRGGSLVVDGEPKVTIAPGKVTTLKLTAGQHFVALLDDTVSRSKLWEKIVDVPAGAQVVEKIDLGTGLGREPVAGKIEEQHSLTLSHPPTVERSNSLDVNMKFIQSTLNGLGVVDFTVYVEHKKQKDNGVAHNTFTLSNVVADPTNCYIQYHRKGVTDGSTRFDTDEGFSLRDIQSIEVKPVAKLVPAGRRASVRTEPPVFQLTPKVSGNSLFGLVFSDEQMAYRVANAMRDAAELCGANGPHVF